MIIGIGIDAVEIARFTDWHQKPLQSLRRIFSDEEIVYCLSSKTLSAQRFAARFAAREAAYKVIHSIPQLRQTPFLTLAKAITIIKNTDGGPMLSYNEEMRRAMEPTNITWHLSITHAKELAIALVVAEQS